MTSSSHATSAATRGAPPQDVVVQAYKAEIQQLKEALHELALRDSSNGNPSFSEVLEGKYLAQIKKCKAFSVQLGTAQQQLADTQKALQAEQEKTKRLVAAATSAAGLSVAGKGKGGGAAHNNKLGRGAGPSLSDKGESNADGTDADDAEEGAKGAAVQRVYDQLHLKEIALAEAQRENGALRSLIKREVGLRDETGDVDGLLNRTTAKAPSSGSGAVVGSGWRGRAEEIVLLKSKLKDAQRAVEAMSAAAAAAAENGQYDDTSQGNGTNVHNGADSLALPASVRAYLGMEECINAETRSAATTTTTAIRRRDVDDEARDRLTAMQQQRAAQQQQQVVDAAQQQRQLQEEKLRTAALQARVKTMKSELDTLRTYVGTMLDKSATDDELVEAYKLEVRHAQEEMREWVKNAAMQGIPNTEMESLKLTGVRDGVGAFSAAATAGTRSVPYRKVALPPPSAVAPPVSVASDARDKQPPASPHPPQQQQQQQQQQSSSSTMQQDVDAVVYEWVRRACQEGTARKDRRAAGAASAADRPSPPPASAVAAVLRSALEHVAQVERHATAVSALGGADATSREGKACPEEEAAATQVEKVLLMENASLKKRMRALTDMVEREMAAQKVLWNSRDAKGEGKHDP